MKDPLVSVVIVNWNGYDDSVECIESLLDLSYPALEIILVDNGSTDNSAERLDTKFPQITVLHNEENKGAAKGYNKGIRNAISKDSEYIWILDNDTIIPNKSTIDKFVQRMESNPGIGMISPIILQYPDTDIVWFYRGVINWEVGFPRHENPGIKQSELEINSEILSNDFIPFCSAFIRSELFEIIPKIPEKYFIYLEDTDYCMQVKEHDFEIITDTTVTIYHKESSSFGTLSPSKSYYLARNHLYFFQRYADNLHKPFYLVYVKWVIIQLWVHFKRGKPKSTLALLRGILDSIRGIQGKGPYP